MNNKTTLDQGKINNTGAIVTAAKVRVFSSKAMKWLANSWIRTVAQWFGFMKGSDFGTRHYFVVLPPAYNGHYKLSDREKNGF